MSNDEEIIFTATNDIITIEGELQLDLIDSDPELLLSTITKAIESVSEMTTDEMYDAYEQFVNDQENDHPQTKVEFLGPWNN
jgi:hydrogenase maturation factor